MIDTVLQKLVEFVETASPFLWETLYRQVYVQVFQNLFWALILLVLTFASYKLYQYCKVKKEEDGEYSSWEIGIFFGVTVAVIFPILSLVCFSEVVVRLMNPNYYAIQLILGSVK